MAKTNAERQAKYKRKQGTGECARLDMMVSLSTKMKLGRLASCCGVSQKEYLEILLKDEERKVLKKLKDSEADDYFDEKLKGRFVIR
jgi:hypothetical protein